MKSKAFTQIELLVVIGIIVLLTAIIIPALQLSRKYAQALQCSSNIRKNTLALVGYDLNNECFPYSFYFSTNISSPNGGQLGNMMYDNLGWRWQNYICGDENINIKGESSFWCPSRKVESTFFKYNVLIANYGVNQSVCKSWEYDKENEFTGPSLSSTDIFCPEESLLIVDSGYSTINWYHVTDSPPVPLSDSIEDRSYLPGLSINKDKNLIPELRDDAIYGRHLNRSVNVGYADGHVSRKKADDLIVKKKGDAYKNRSPLWIPRKK